MEVIARRATIYPMLRKWTNNGEGFVRFHVAVTCGWSVHGSCGRKSERHQNMSFRGQESPPRRTTRVAFAGRSGPRQPVVGWGAPGRLRLSHYDAVAIIGWVLVATLARVAVNGRFFSCIWYRRVLEFVYSTCGSVAIGSLRRFSVAAAAATVAYVSANKCIRAIRLWACKYLSLRSLGVSCLRSLSSLGMEAYTLLEAITRIHAWEMIVAGPTVAFWPRKSRQEVSSRYFVRQDLTLPAFSPAMWYFLTNTRAIVGQGGFWFAVDVSPIKSVNTRADGSPGRLRKGGGSQRE